MIVGLGESNGGFPLQGLGGGLRDLADLSLQHARRYEYSVIFADPPLSFRIVSAGVRDDSDAIYLIEVAPGRLLRLAPNPGSLLHC